MDELVTISRLVQEAGIPDDSKSTLEWCIGRLPDLYEKFEATYESRFREGILQLEQALLRPFGKKHAGVAEQIRNELRTLHTRVGLEGRDEAA
jgi:hypothetical protein